MVGRATDEATPRDAHTDPAPSDRGPFRVATWSAGASLISGVSALVTRGNLYCLSTLAAFCGALVALICLAVASWRRGDARDPVAGCVAPKQYRLGCALVVAGAAVAALLAVGFVRSLERTVGVGVGFSNVHGLRIHASRYIESAGQFPQTIGALRHAGLGQTGAVCPFDPQAHVGDPDYTSYVWRPFVAPVEGERALVLAYERGAWTPLELALWPRFGRWVLLGDGDVRQMDDADLSWALEADIRRRAEIGWPTEGLSSAP